MQEEEQNCGGAEGVAEQAASRRRHRGVASRFGECGAPVEAAEDGAEEDEAAAEGDADDGAADEAE